MSADKFGWKFPGQVIPALKGIDLLIEPGERVLIVGSSGSGKSTLAKALAGVLREPDDGESCGLLNVSRDRPVGLVLQQPDDQTVMERVHDDVAFGLENALVEPSLMPSIIHDALQKVSLNLPEDHPTALLSGGQRQRLALAGVLAMEPGLVVLDEPTSALDQVGKSQVIQAVKELAAGENVTLVVIDHQASLWEGVIDRVVTLEDGLVVGNHAASEYDFGREAIAKPPARKIGRNVLEAEGLVISRDGANPLSEPYSVTVRSGEILALMGPNASGKTTLALTLAGILTPLSGRVAVDGDSLTSLASQDLEKVVGFVPQNPAHAFFASTVAKEMGSLQTTVLEQWGLASTQDSHPHALSGGQQRRLALALATSGEKKLIVLDEPSQSLDEAGWNELVTALHDASDQGIAIVMSTHDERLVEAVGAMILPMKPLAPAKRDSPRPSLLTRANPVALVGAAMLPAIALVTTIDVVSALTALVLLLALAPFLRKSLSGLGVRVLPVGLAAVFSAITIALYGQTSGTVFWEWGLMEVSEGSLELGLATALRIMAIGFPAVLLLSRVDVTRFADALVQQARMPENFVVGGLAGLRLFGVVASDREIRNGVARVRGRANPNSITRVISSVISILVLSLRRADTLATAMEVRGFGFSSRRTHFRTSRWRVADSLWLAGGAIVGLVSVGLAIVAGSFNAILG